MARRTTQETEQLFVSITSGASEWIDENALDDFPGGVVPTGFVVQADHPILRVHGDWFEPVRPDTKSGRVARLAGELSR